MFRSCGQKNNFRESERERRAYFLWVWWVLIEEFLFLMEEVMCLWMEGGLCRGIEEGAIGGEKFIGFCGTSKSFILILCFFFNFNFLILC